MILKDDNINPSPNADNFNLWLRKKISEFTEDDWKIMRYAYQKGVEDGEIKA